MTDDDTDLSPSAGTMMKPNTIRLEWEGKEHRSSEAGMPLHIISETAFSDSSAGKSTRPNRLIQGDNLLVMRSLLPEMKGKFRILYADPPFATGKGFNRRVGTAEDSRKPETWKLAGAYSDSWKSMERYLSMLYPRLAVMRELLANNGTLYLHLDWHAVHYARILLDEIFGAANFINEIVWVYHGPSPVRSYFNRKHDTILVYAKGPKAAFYPDQIRVPYHPNTRRTFESSRRAGFGKRPDLDRGKIPEDWWYFPVVARLHNQRTGYPTQKPEALLERIILASSRSGDWVGDFFCGSGTTLECAGRLGRRWIGCDILPEAIGICQRRLALDEKLSPYRREGLPPERARSEARLTLAIQTVKSGRTLDLTIRKMTPCTPNGFPQSLDFWEVDFDYNGEIFRSRQQFARPWRSGYAPLSATTSYSRKGEYRVAVRAISTDGRTAFLEKKVWI